jgi:hypothetical protein
MHTTGAMLTRQYPSKTLQQRTAAAGSRGDLPAGGVAGGVDAGGAGGCGSGSTLASNRPGPSTFPGGAYRQMTSVPAVKGVCVMPALQT